jgi:penicillin-binding protein 2
MYLDSDRGPSLTPQLAIRVAVIGGIALVAFAVIFFRLWYLQVLSGTDNLEKARVNQVRSIKIQAPRGEIVDRKGRVLVDNRTGLAVKITPKDLPASEARRREVYDKVGKIVGIPGTRVTKSVEEQLKAQPFATATVKQDVPQNTVAYLLENQDSFPGVTVERVFLRSYPHHQIGAHLFGFVGEVNDKQIKDQRYSDVSLGDRVGQSGIEYQYDRFLRGRNGKARLQVDALGSLRRELRTYEPRQGQQLRLSLDLKVQEAGQQALGGARGAFVVMNVNTGAVLGLGSSPSFDPNIFAKAVRQSDYDKLVSKDNGEPLTNRAIQGAYPTGSTFKLITATAALEGGLITPDTVVDDPGKIRVGGIDFKNAGGAVNGAVAMRQALSVSSDVYFYKLGLAADGKGDGLLIQNWARKLGMGHRTGIDLPEERPGLLPTPKWRDRLFKQKLTDRPWAVGDNINLSVGQGDLQADPLQLAVAYSAIANGGKIVTPRLGERLEDQTGRPQQVFEPPEPRRLNIKPETRQTILEGLRAAASEPGGTSAPVFAGFKIPVAGKTGTAEKGAGRADQSWYCGLAPYPSIQYVTCATFETGGFGAETAAPAVRQIMTSLFDVRDSGPVRSGTAPN